ncbi:MAG: hypothetical protein JWO36_6516 [Myxococcales bacterium]|nr:hypothetical protein [Myxococcales bacterium]
MHRAAWVALVVLASSRAGAEPACAAESAELRAHLTIAVRNADRWNLAWQIAFGGLAAGQFALALAHDNPLGPFDRDYQETLYVGGAKATLGFASRLLTPLRIALPPETSDPCADRTALRAAVQDAAHRERNLFWLTQVGTIVVNAAGAVVLGERRSWSVGAISFALGYPVGLISLYTMPRASWHLVREARWTIAAVPRDGGFSIAVAGTF